MAFRKYLILSRGELPAQRGVHFFEENNEAFARLRQMALIRSMDLYCLAILSMLDQLNKVSFWKEFFECKGQFEATQYWEALPVAFRVGS
jgi:hypothetical protein